MNEKIINKDASANFATVDANEPNDESQSSHSLGKLETFFIYILNRRWLTILIIFILALFLRSTVTLLTDRVSKDAVLYVYMARDIADGNLDKSFNRNRRMPPLYLFGMAGATELGLSVENGGKLISILSGALLVIVVYLIAEMIFSSHLAALASFLVAVNPNLIKISAKIMRDSLYLFLLFLSLYLLIKAFKNEKWNIFFWGGAGAFLSLAVAVRTEAIELIIFAILAIIIESFILIRESYKDFSSNENRTKVDKTFALRIGAKWIVGFLVLLLLYFTVSIPFNRVLKGSTSTWSIIDNRIASYFKTILKTTDKDLIDLEERQ